MKDLELNTVFCSANAILISDNETIAKTKNQCIEKDDPTAHAVVEVLRMAKIKLKNSNLQKCEIKVTNYLCPMCATALRSCCVQKIMLKTEKKEEIINIENFYFKKIV